MNNYSYELGGIAKQRKELPFASFRERNIMPMKGRLFSMKEAFFLQKEGVFGKLMSNFRYVCNKIVALDHLRPENRVLVIAANSVTINSISIVELSFFDERKIFAHK